MAINVSVQYNGRFPWRYIVDPRLLPSGNHFKCYGKGFVFVAHVTSVLYT